jgi:hypothetical protein
LLGLLWWKRNVDFILNTLRNRNLSIENFVFEKSPLFFDMLISALRLLFILFYVHYLELGKLLFRISGAPT